MTQHGGSGVHPYFQVHRRAQIHPYVKFRKHSLATLASRKGGARDAAQGQQAWRLPDLCAAYQFPPGNAPGGGVIALVELGGGWRQSDVDTFFGGLGQPSPAITDVVVNGPGNQPGRNTDADGEVALDIQVAAASYFAATGQRATIRVYWAGDGDIAAGVTAAAEDGCDVCSISWGSDEANWSPQAAQAMEQAALNATTSGMVVFAAAGDNDSSDGGPNPANVDLPASCPHVVACGGTSKTASTETVWNNTPGNPSGEGTGGGFSTLFPPQPWQLRAPSGGGRMVPDVAANADPLTGYEIVLNGQPEVIGGTSAVAPLYAGLFASFGNRLGFVSPSLWKTPLAFVDITQGDNGVYKASVGPDPCTGLGAPVGTAIAALFENGAAAHLIAVLKQRDASLRQLQTV